MATKPFHSILFEKYIQPNDPEWRAKAEAELLYRIFDLFERACTCFDCKDMRKDYYERLKKMLGQDKQARINSK